MSGPGGATQLVAVLRRKGRFLTAEPLFAAGEGAGRGIGAPVVSQARSSNRSRGGAGEGDLVVVGLSRRTGARVIRRLGRPDVARDVIEGLLLDRGVRRGFSSTVEHEAAGAGERVMASAAARRDLQDLATFTIDPVSARDFDDAISARAEPDGSVRVWVHIADVAAHVPEGSALDREALRRATSVYVPGTVEPMLPHALSSDACSLRPGVPRPAVTVELELDGASVRSAAFYRSLIRSDARLDYEQVDRVFAGSERAAEPWAQPLEVARAAAAALRRRREAAGALALDSPEPEFELDRQGYVTAVNERTQTESHGLIEQLMIAANEAVAEHLNKRGVPCLYRVHERPEPDRVERLVAQLASLEVPTPAVPERMSPSQAAQLLGEISLAVQRHLNAGDGHGAMALGSLLLRSLKQAYYSPQNIGHAGLHSSAYCHFTSPIRRYPDLVCHRALLSSIGGEERPPRRSDLAELGSWTSERERQAMVLERDGDDIAACFALERLLGPRLEARTLQGEITGLIGAGAFVAFGLDGGGRPFQGMLPVRLLKARSEGDGAPGRAARRGERQEREWWELNEEGTILYGQRSGATLRLGEEVQVRVGRIDAVRGRVDLEPAG